MNQTVNIRTLVLSISFLCMSVWFFGCATDLPEESLSESSKTAIDENEYIAPADESYLNLSDIYLNSTDIPSGYELDEMDNLDNETIAPDWPNVSEALIRYESWGRIDGYDVEFSKEVYSDADSVALFKDIAVACSSYTNANGASEDYAFQELQGDLVNKNDVESLGGTQYAFNSTDDVYVGDDSFSTKTTYSQTLDNKNMTVTQRQVVFRRGSVVCNVSVTSYGGEPPKVSDLEFIANNQDTLIEQAVRN